MAGNAEEILKSIADVKAIMQDENKTLGERVAQAEGTAQKALNEIQEFRKTFVPADSPISKIQGDAATQRGGLFSGKMQLPYAKAVTLPPSNPVLMASDRERLQIVQDLHDALVVRYWNSAMKGPALMGRSPMDDVKDSIDFKLYAQWMVDLGYAKAANDILNPAGGTGGGPQLDFTLLSSQLVDLVRLSGRVAPQFRVVPLTRAKQEFPALRSDTKALLGGTTLPVTDADNIGGGPPSGFRTNPTFGQVAFDCVHCLGFMLWTDDMFEDSVVPFLPMMREQAAIMIARAQDQAILDGDDTATHMDHHANNTVAAPDFRKAWDGLRKLGENNEATINAAITSGNFNTLRLKMGKWGENPSALVMFLRINQWLALLADTNLLTVEKIGIDRATLRRGVVDQVFGIDIVVSEFVRGDLNTAGVYDDTTTNNTVEILCNRERFWMGQKGDVRVEQVRAPQALANWLQADVRCDFQAIDKNDTDNVFASGDAPVAIGVDVTA